MTKWRDESVLRRLYVDRGMSMSEVAEELGCSVGTISNWLAEHEIETADRGAQYKDTARLLGKQRLIQLYHGEGLSSYQIAELCDVSPKSVLNWLDEYGLEKRKPNWERPPPFETKPDDGYERWRHHTDDKRVTVFVHRLLAVSEYGLDGIRGKSVHHKNNIPWDNRPDNIEPMDPIEHRRMHNTKDSDT